MVWGTIKRVTHPRVCRHGKMNIRLLCKVKGIPISRVARALGWSVTTLEAVAACIKPIWPHERAAIAKALKVYPPEALEARMRVIDGEIARNSHSASLRRCGEVGGILDETQPTA